MPKDQRTPPQNTREIMMDRPLTEHLGNEWRDILPTIKVPTLALIAKRGTFNNEFCLTVFLKSIKNSQLHFIKEAGHGYYV